METLRDDNLTEASKGNALSQCLEKGYMKPEEVFDYAYGHAEKNGDGILSES